MRTGALVRLFHGQVFEKFARRWMEAGRTGDPITSTGLANLNGGVMPVVVVPAWTPAQEAS